MKTTPPLLALLVLIASVMHLPVHAAQPAFVADTIIINAVVHTMDPAQPLAEAVAIYANRIVAVGATKDIKQFAGPNTRIIDARQRLLLPGFNDAHTHFLSGGFQLSSVDLRDANSPQEFAARIKAFAEKLPKGRWVTGGDWDHERWPDAKLPTKELIDSFTPDTPVFVNRLDGHMALADRKRTRLNSSHVS